MGYFMWFSQVLPMGSFNLNLQYFVNETFLLALSYMALGLSDVTLNQQRLSDYGLLLVFVILALIAFNLLALILTLTSIAKKAIVKKYNEKFKSKKVKKGMLEKNKGQKELMEDMGAEKVDRSPQLDEPQDILMPFKDLPD